MTEILALSNPALFGRATRVRRTVKDASQKLALSDHWQIDVAAMLSQLAHVSLPAETAEKLCRATELSAEERAMTARLPEVTDQLLAHIPRLETVRVMLAKSQEPYRQSNCVPPEAEAQLVEAGANLIKAAIAFDSLTHGGLAAGDAIGIMRGQPERFDQDVVNVLGDLYADAGDTSTIVEVPVMGLVKGMVLAEDLVSNSGMLLVARGFEVTPTFMERIRNYKSESLKKTIRVIR